MEILIIILTVCAVATTIVFIIKTVIQIAEWWRRSGGGVEARWFHSVGKDLYIKQHTDVHFPYTVTNPKGYAIVYKASLDVDGRKKINPPISTRQTSMSGDVVLYGQSWDDDGVKPVHCEITVYRKSFSSAAKDKEINSVTIDDAIVVKAGTAPTAMHGADSQH